MTDREIKLKTWLILCRRFRRQKKEIDELAAVVWNLRKGIEDETTREQLFNVWTALIDASQDMQGHSSWCHPQSQWTGGDSTDPELDNTTYVDPHVVRPSFKRSFPKEEIAYAKRKGYL